MKLDECFEVKLMMVGVEKHLNPSPIVTVTVTKSLAFLGIRFLHLLSDYMCFSTVNALHMHIIPEDPFLYQK